MTPLVWRVLPPSESGWWWCKKIGYTNASAVMIRARIGKWGLLVVDSEPNGFYDGSGLAFAGPVDEPSGDPMPSADDKELPS